MRMKSSNFIKDVLIWGASGHALVVADIIRLQNQYQIIGFLDNINLHLKNTQFANSDILGGEEQLEILKAQGVNNIIIAIGDCSARLKIANLVEQHGFNLATAIHPRVIMAADVPIGEGSVICAGAVISSSAKIGKNVIINTSATVDHECIIEDGVHIGPGVHLGGKTTIKKGTWVGIGATISDHIIIGSNSIIGAGAIVLKDIPDRVVAYGIPAKIIRNI